METDITIRWLQSQDIMCIVKAFEELGWKGKTASQYEQYLREQEEQQRLVLVAFVEGAFAGYVTICWETDYVTFEQQNIPEIRDFNVLPKFRRRKIGTKLMDEAERYIAERSEFAGIGVGMDKDYGAAQRMYVLRGYVPDGLGLTSHGKHLSWGETVVVDDGLVLFFTKKLR